MRTLSSWHIVFAVMMSSGFAASAHAQAHYFQNGGTLHGSGFDGINALALGAGDNIWAVGTTMSPSLFYDIFDPLDGSRAYAGNATAGTAYLGLFRPSTSFTGMIDPVNTTGIQRATSVVTDAVGNVYVAGRFGNVMSTCDTNVGAVGPSDLYIVSFGPEGGCRWGRVLSGSSIEILTLNALALDGLGDLFIAGQFGSSGDASPANFYAEPLSTDVEFFAPAAGQSSGFVVKLDTNGGYYGSAQVSGTCPDSIDSAAIAADPSGNVYAGFELVGAGHCAGGADQLEVIKFDNALNPLWTKTISAANQSSLAMSSLVVSAGGTVAVAGSASSTVTLYAGEIGTYPIGGAPGNTNGFLLRMDNAGNYLSSGTLYGSGASSIDALRFDAAGRLWYSASFTDNDLDPTQPSSHHGTAAVSNDVAIGVIKASGRFAYLNTIRCLSADCLASVISLAPTSYGSLVMAGPFTGQIDLDLGGLPTTFTSDGDEDDFIITTQTDGVFENAFD